MSHRNAPLHLCKISLSIFLFKAASSSLPVILEIGAAIYPDALCTLLPSKWPWDFSRNSFFFFFFLPLLYHPYSSSPSLGRLLICLHPANSAPWHLSCSYLSSVSTGSLRKLTSAPPFALDSNPAPTPHRSHSELSKMLSFHACGLCQKLLRGISLPCMPSATFFKLFILYLSIADKQTMLW